MDKERKNETEKIDDKQTNLLCQFINSLILGLMMVTVTLAQPYWLSNNSYLKQFCSSYKGLREGTVIKLNTRKPYEEPKTNISL